jgi:nitrate/nitrite transport system permease protein
MKKFVIHVVLLPVLGFGALLLLWTAASAITKDPQTGRASLPGIARTWEESKLYVLEPFAKRDENDQGILRMTSTSLVRVLEGFGIALLVAVPVGFLIGSSKTFAGCVDPVIQVLRPVSPLAWYPIMYAVFLGLRSRYDGLAVGEWAAVFTVAVCAMWPTILNTAAGVRAIPQDYHNVSKVLNLTGFKKLFRVLLPATLPQMFTGFRLSLGIAWFVIVAAEMLTGKNGIGGFLNQEFNAGRTEHIFLCVITIGLVGLALDRLMNLAERNVHLLLDLPGTCRRALAAILPQQERRLAHAGA